MPQRYRIKRKDDVYQLLKNKRNFEFMSDRLLQQLIDNMSVLRFKKGETVLLQGKRTKAFFILITGNLSVIVDRKFLYKLNRTGDVVGELSFITQNPCSATIKAANDVGVVAITRELLKKVNKVEFFLWLCRILGDKLVRTSKIKTGTLDETKGNQSNSDSAQPASTDVSPIEQTAEEQSQASLPVEEDSPDVGTAETTASSDDIADGSVAEDAGETISTTENIPDEVGAEQSDQEESSTIEETEKSTENISDEVGADAAIEQNDSEVASITEKSVTDI